jgi:hypothetical protein
MSGWQKLVLEVPIRPFSLNAERTKGHWSQVRAEVTIARDAGYLIAKKALAGAEGLERVSIDVYPWSRDRRGRQDPGNCYSSAKAIIDGFVRARLIPDDSDTHVAWLRFWPHQFGRDAHVLILEEVPE